MADNILLIVLGHGTVADVRWGKFGAAQSTFAASLDLDNAGTELAVMARNSSVVVLVPARHVVLRNTQFQGKSRLATPMALAFQHESELLTDVEQMHWVIVGREQMNFGIAGVTLTQMQTWCERLRACGLQADKMLPDVLALPLPGECSAAYWPDRWLIRTGKWQGMQLPCAWVDSELPVTPDLCLHAGDTVPPAWESESSAGDPLWQLANEAGRSKINLLQGKFKPALRWPWFIPGKTACALILISCSLLVCGLYHQLKAGQAERQMAALYQHLSPGQSLTASPVEEARKKARQMQNILKEPQLFKLLPYATEALSLWEQPQLQSLIFDGAKNELVITLLKEDTPLPLPSEDNGIVITMTEGPSDNLVILTVGGEQ
ncbi:MULTISPECIES: type II secretion system protein GspL [unclassified Serratia (in: enterobacteria)]|uniref:type II secretion system protein GspL n=1 Tax=unclassified Serratia (in: enterobacteria) TaxID=2647522 RepID=UPI002ED5A34C|nr:type II secretion system protein GspL [Serratia sp. C2(2)]MEE4447863.1 type II secretion system protein GspL [Serratia sp. C2(1)]